MPIRIGDAKIGDVVRLPKWQMIAQNGHGMLYEFRYHVTGKTPGSVWLMTDNELVWNKTVKHRADHPGIYQVDENMTFSLEGETPPPKMARQNSAPGEHDKTRVRRGKDAPYLFEWGDDEINLDDLPRQAQVVAQILYETGRSEFTETEIQEILEQPENVEKLATKQPPIRIFYFYRKDYSRKGLMNRGKSGGGADDEEEE